MKCSFVETKLNILEDIVLGGRQKELDRAVHKTMADEYIV